jgi:hypothetical protein
VINELVMVGRDRPRKRDNKLIVIQRYIHDNECIGGMVWYGMVHTLDGRIVCDFYFEECT